MPLIGCGQAPPLADFLTPAGESFKLRRADRKDKVVLVMGATGTGKSRLAIDLATKFGAEVVNSDKMQVYDGLDVVTNKVTVEERAGVRHHLLGGVPPDADFTARDFRRRAALAVERIVGRGRLPVIAGGSNSYIKELVEGERGEFGVRYECCFLWVDVKLPVLHGFVAERVDMMVERGLVEEVRGVFEPEADYTRGVRRAIGLPELDRYLRAEREAADEAVQARMLEVAIDEIKRNTRKLARSQLQKIHGLSCRWPVHRVDATAVFRKRGREADRAWEELVAGPSIEIVRRFLFDGDGVAAMAMENSATASAAAITTKSLSNIESFGATCVRFGSYGWGQGICQDGGQSATCSR